MLFGETDGVWFITTYLEKGLPTKGADIFPHLCYNRINRFSTGRKEGSP